MSKKRYQISPIELVQWAEPLFGFGEGKATGFSEKKVAAYEAAAGIRLPVALREYYLACGKASLNYALHDIFIPDRDAKPFKGRLTFSYDHIEEDLKYFKEAGEEDYEELAKLRTLPRERWGEVTGNYLLFWCENQGCWYAGIKAEDLTQPNPAVYYNDQDDVYSWAPFADSVSSFLLNILLENLEPEANPDEIKNSAEIQKVLSEGSVDFQRLCEPYPFPGGRFCHTCLDIEADTLYVYGEEAKGRPAYLKILKPDEEDIDNFQREEDQMLELRDVPLTCKEGVYSIIDFSKDIDGGDAISFDYDAQYQMLTYDIPVGEDWREMTLYSVSEEEIFRTLRAFYGKDGALQKITAVLKGRETLLYIRYENEEDAKKKIQRFAIRNANTIIEQIQQCTDVVARLFIDYYIDSENIDYHAVIGTAAEMEEVRQKGCYEDSGDYSGNYLAEYIEGDNEMLIAMVRCAEGYPSKNFQYAVEIMSKHIEEHALAALRKTEDFKFICAEYD